MLLQQFVITNIFKQLLNIVSSDKKT